MDVHPDWLAAYNRAETAARGAFPGLVRDTSHPDAVFRAPVPTRDEGFYAQVDDYPAWQRLRAADYAVRVSLFFVGARSFHRRTAEYPPDGPPFLWVDLVAPDGDVVAVAFCLPRTLARVARAWADSAQPPVDIAAAIDQMAARYHPKPRTPFPWRDVLAQPAIADAAADAQNAAGAGGEALRALVGWT